MDVSRLFSGVNALQTSGAKLHQATELQTRKPENQMNNEDPDCLDCDRAPGQQLWKA